MCGRFTLASPAQAVAAALGLTDFPTLSPRYNVAPTQSVPIVRVDPAGRREPVEARWGLVPGWTRDLARAPLLFNARAETAAEKPSFRAAFRNRRCAIPADGFFEWTGAARERRAYYFSLSDGSPFAFAGLWERWLDPRGEALDSCTILTIPPNELLARYHDRMPAILPAPALESWLDASNRDPTSLMGLLTPFPSERMRAWRVGPLVNSAKNDLPSVTVPVPENASPVDDAGKA